MITDDLNLKRSRWRRVECKQWILTKQRKPAVGTYKQHEIYMNLRTAKTITTTTTKQNLRQNPTAVEPQGTYVGLTTKYAVRAVVHIKHEGPIHSMYTT